MLALNWEEPGPSRRAQKTKVELDRVAHALKSRPGEWALVEEGVSNGGSSAKKYQNRGCETTHRGVLNDEGQYRYKVYARWPAEDAADTQAPVPVTPPAPAPAVPPSPPSRPHDGRPVQPPRQAAPVLPPVAPPARAEASTSKPVQTAALSVRQVQVQGIPVVPRNSAEDLISRAEALGITIPSSIDLDVADDRRIFASRLQTMEARDHRSRGAR